MRAILQFAAAAGIAVLVAGPVGHADASHVPSISPIEEGHGSLLVLPMMNAKRGKKLFVDKGCVACHAINGVGGHDASALDSHQMDHVMHPFDFAAKMWNHAYAMISSQVEALGDQIYLTGEELADIIAFVHDDEIQHGFTEKDLTAKARKMMAHEHEGVSAPASHAHEIGHDKEKQPEAKPHGH